MVSSRETGDSATKVGAGAATGAWAMRTGTTSGPESRGEGKASTAPSTCGRSGAWRTGTSDGGGGALSAVASAAAKPAAAAPRARPGAI